MQYSEIGIMSVCYQLSTIVVLLQVTEWFAMRGLIAYQKGRSLEEITFEHCNAPIHHYQKSFRQQEKCRRIWIVLFIVFCCLSQAALEFLGHFFNAGGNVFIGYNLMILTLIIINFMFLFHQMQKYHRYEFKQNKRRMIVFVSTMMFAYTVNISFLFLSKEIPRDITSLTSLYVSCKSGMNQFVLDLRVIIDFMAKIV